MYSTDLDASLGLCVNSLDEIAAKVSSGADLAALSPILQSIKYSLVKDNITLVNSKIKSKTKLNSSLNKFNEMKVKSEDLNCNPLLLKLINLVHSNKNLNYKINTNLSDLSAENSSNGLSNLNADLIPQGLILEIDDIKQKLQDDESIIIPPSSLLDQFNENLQMNKSNQFKLIQMINVYSKKLSNLHWENSKWVKEMDGLKNFVNNDLTAFNNKLNEKFKDLASDTNDGLDNNNNPINDDVGLELDNELNDADQQDAQSEEEDGDEVEEEDDDDENERQPDQQEDTEEPSNEQAEDEEYSSKAENDDNDNDEAGALNAEQAEEDGENEDGQSRADEEPNEDADVDMDDEDQPRSPSLPIEDV